MLANQTKVSKGEQPTLPTGFDVDFSFQWNAYYGTTKFSSYLCGKDLLNQTVLHSCHQLLTQKLKLLAEKAVSLVLYR